MSLTTTASHIFYFKEMRPRRVVRGTFYNSSTQPWQGSHNVLWKKGNLNIYNSHDNWQTLFADEDVMIWLKAPESHYMLRLPCQTAISIHPFIHPSIHLSIYLSNYLSIPSILPHSTTQLKATVAAGLLNWNDTNYHLHVLD